MRIDRLRRREVITLLGGTAAAWPLVATGQQAERLRRLGVLMPLPESTFAAAFGELRQNGLVEGQSLVIDRRGFGAPYELFASLARELVSAGPHALLCAGDAAIKAAQAATSTIPIVGMTDDMVGAGLVRSLANPGSNTTGVSILAGDLDGKRQDILLEFFPHVRRIAALSDAHNNTPAQLQVLRDMARYRRVDLSIHSVERIEEIAPAIETAHQDAAEALNVLASPLLHNGRQTIFAQSLKRRLPAMYQWPESAEEGGLLAYGPRQIEPFRQVARQLVKVLRGANPADIPVEQPTRFELVVNLKTARGMGLEISPMLLARADGVIE